MKHTILLTALLMLLVSGCTKQPINKGMSECKVINNNHFLGDGLNEYHISCPEGVYRCFIIFQNGITCKQLERK